MTEILLIMTGGTIGSQVSGGTIDTSSDTRFKLLELFRRHDGNERQIRFVCRQPLQLLSENLVPSVWEQIILAIEAERPERYAGIIVTHGTDTLAYTAAALSYYFHALATPILLVSSDRPLDHPEANGAANFVCAVEFIRQQHQAGVYVPYRNRAQGMHLHRGARLASSLPMSGDFISVRFKHYMQFADNRFQVLDSAPERPERSALPKLKPNFSEPVLMIRPYPGLDYSRFNLEGVRAVCHDLYHSGTACASPYEDGRHSLIAFLQRCRERGVKVYLAPAAKSEAAYRSTRELLAAGAEMIWNIALEAAYVKLLLAYGNFDAEREIKAFLDADLAWEHVVP